MSSSSSSSSSLWLMMAYVVIALALQAVVIVLGMLLDEVAGSWSTPLFLGLYFLMFWLAWPIALRVTAPRASASAETQSA
jgi:uncharacterized membrane protein